MSAFNVVTLEEEDVPGAKLYKEPRAAVSMNSSDGYNVKDKNVQEINVSSYPESRVLYY